MEIMRWEITDIDALGRIGKLTINKKQMDTPNLFPVVHPYKNILSPKDLKNMGAQSVFTNAYIIYQNIPLRLEVLEKGIHRYLNFDGIVATDSGAFQKYFYNKDDLNISPEEIEKFQEKIDSDFSVILDDPVQPDDDYETAKLKVFTTLERAKDNVNRRNDNNSNWFGPIHGAKYFDLLKISTTEMSRLPFDVYAIGGLVKLFLNYRFELTLRILLNVKRHVINNKPIHMFGLGLPQFFSLAVACGCDIMDSAAYILFAKENRYFTISTGTRKLEELIEFPCHCPICCEYTPNEILNFDKKLRTELLAKHNLYISFSELRTIRQAIKEGNLWELVEQRVRNHPNLVDAFVVIKDNIAFFEKYEKVYKQHGRLYVSPESVYRPLIYRYELKLINNYRVPKEAKFLIILPELDVRSDHSPSIKRWLEEINNNSVIPRRLIHIAFISDFYGIVPLELNNTFPMGQSESFTRFEINGILYKNLINKVKSFIDHFHPYYSKCGVLIPENYVNQFNEIIKFTKKDIIHGLILILKSKFNSRVSFFNNIQQLLQFLK